MRINHNESPSHKYVDRVQRESEREMIPLLIPEACRLTINKANQSGVLSRAFEF